MAKTPFIRPLQVQGGTFYAFSSAAEDLSFTFNNSVDKFKFSKFALLNIPDINSGDPLGNSIKLNAPDSAFLDYATSSGNIITGNANTDFSQSFQSYCLNFETTVLSSDNYNSDLKQNISERVFFKWLKELGAIRYQPASSDQVVSTLDQNTVLTVNGLPSTQKRYVEGDPSGGTGSYGLTGSTYNRVVQYIGNLDIVNSVKNNNNTYSEVYVHVPTKDGNTPTVLFKNVVDENYYPDFQWTNNPADPLDKEYLTGRSYDELNPSGLTTLAIFDDDVLGLPNVTFEDTADGTTGSGNWYTPRDTANTYFTDSSFVDPTAQILSKSVSGATSGVGFQKYVRTRLDSVGIDFDPDSYKQIVDDASISTLEEFNATSISQDFEFNAVLIYYDVYDPADPTNSATNLYGVLFLDDVQTTGSGIYSIPRFQKYKPNIVTKLNGNSYGLKLNIKFDVDIDQTGVEQAINDYSPFSLTMFMDAVNVLQDASSTLNNNAASYIDLEARVSAMENLMLTQDTSASLDRRIASLESAYASNQALFNNTQSVMGLITQNYELIRAIINNETSVEISYNLDAIKQGSGVIVNRSIPNQVMIENNNQEFNLGQGNGTITLQNNALNRIGLRSFGNYCKHINNGTPITLTSDLSIRIDDSITTWKKGQTFKFSFGDQIIPNDFTINFLTNAVGKYPLSNPSGVAYSNLIISLVDSDISSYDYMPVIEIVCIDDENLVFQTDIVGKSLTNNG